MTTGLPLVHVPVPVNVQTGSHREPEEQQAVDQPGRQEGREDLPPPEPCCDPAPGNLSIDVNPPDVACNRTQPEGRPYFQT